MMRGIVEQIADTVLYEGYILYPYRPSALKNRQRWNFGGLCPPAYSDIHAGSESSRAQTEILSVGAASKLEIRVRFLHLIERRVAKLADSVGNSQPTALPSLADSDLLFVDSLRVDNRLYQTWQEAAEREINLPALDVTATGSQPQRFAFHLPESKQIEPLARSDAKFVGALVRQQNPLDFAAQISVENLHGALHKIRLEIRNLTPCPDAAKLTRDQAMTHSLISTHAILNIRDGEFVSSLDPPVQLAQAVANCANLGLYPVLAGHEGDRATILASPVILYDYPQIAPESAGDLFDGAEIDEILTLRILALSDEEKSEMRQSDERARRILDRIEADPQHLASLHGIMRNVRGEQ